VVAPAPGLGWAVIFVEAVGCSADVSIKSHDKIYFTHVQHVTNPGFSVRTILGGWIGPAVSLNTVTFIQTAFLMPIISKPLTAAPHRVLAVTASSQSGNLSSNATQCKV
jgi:hypothetical protein